MFAAATQVSLLPCCKVRQADGWNAPGWALNGNSMKPNCFRLLESIYVQSENIYVFNHMYKFLQACTRIKMYKDRCISKTKVKQCETCNRPNDQRLVWVYKNLLYRLYPVLIITPLGCGLWCLHIRIWPIRILAWLQNQTLTPQGQQIWSCIPYHTRHFPIISCDFYVYVILHQAEVKEEWLIIL